MDVEQLDLRGEVCPFTLISTRKRVNELDAEAVLDVLVDAPDAVRTIPQWGRNAGHHVSEPEALVEGGWSIRLELRQTDRERR